jgi:anion-transporting  ArsA/GET3 family ATPase
MSGVEAILDGRRVVICAGSGGVGKTTTAATIAVGLAASGGARASSRSTRRGAWPTLLGLDELGNEPQRRRRGPCRVRR